MSKPVRLARVPANEVAAHAGVMHLLPATIDAAHIANSVKWRVGIRVVPISPRPYDFIARTGHNIAFRRMGSALTTAAALPPECNSRDVVFIRVFDHVALDHCGLRTTRFG
jgi:hypothetical protein